MRRRRLGFSDLQLTVVGLGTFAIGGAGWQFGWGPQDDNDSVDTIHRALDVGINWIDTAPIYGLGHSEEIVGKAVKGRRESVILATKCGRVWDPDTRKTGRSLKAESVRAEIEASLRRLQTEWIDLYQIHWPQPEEDIEEGWAEIARAVKAGKIRYAGVSNFSVEQLERVQKIHPVASLQPPYSMVRRDVESGLLGYCAAHNVGVICYSPMQSGLLTGAFTRERAAALPVDDWRRESPLFKEPVLTANLDLAEGLKALASRSGHTAGQLAVAWVLRRPELTGAIVGGRKSAQIDQNAGAADWDPDPGVLAQVDTLLAQRLAKIPK